MALNLFHIS